MRKRSFPLTVLIVLQHFEHSPLVPLLGSGSFPLTIIMTASSRSLLSVLLALLASEASGFAPLPPQNARLASSLSAASALDFAILQDRVQEMRRQSREVELKLLPPNVDLEAVEFCQLLLEALQSPDDPRPDAGFQILLKSSTKKWKSAIYRAVGAPAHANADKVASAMSSAVHEEGNKFQLLVEDDVSIEIATEPLDFMDGTCWVKCRLQRGDSSAMLGLSLVREHGAWMLDEMDWQDGDRYFVD